MKDNTLVAIVNAVTVKIAFAAVLIIIPPFLINILCLNILVNSSYYLMMGKYLHKVLEGETIYSVSKKYGVPAYFILRENNVKDIWEGLRIIIPEVSGIKYIVQPFDTLQSISNIFTIDVELVKKHNGIEKVFIGQVIYIPYMEEN